MKSNFDFQEIDRAMSQQIMSEVGSTWAEKCRECGGAGFDDDGEDCEECGGVGEIEYMNPHVADQPSLAAQHGLWED